MRYQAYPGYKESEIEWIGSMPSDWAISRMKFFSQLNPSKQEVRDLPSEIDVTFLPMESIGEKGELDVSASKSIADLINGYTYVGENDVLIAKITPCFENGKGAIARGLKNGVAFATTEVIPLRAVNIGTNRFIYYLLSCGPFRKIAEGSMYGAGGQKRVSDGFVANYHFAKPSDEECVQIANFLDHETAKIDTLIAKQQQLIKLLKEKRQAVISHAVTKGLNPDAPMKDSGVEWLGEVPEHWQVGRVKNLASLISKGTTPTTIGGEFLDEGVQFLKAENIGKQFYVSEAPEFYISAEVDEQLSRSRLQAKDVLVIIAGATTGLCSVLPEKILPANTNQAVSFIRPKNKTYAEFIAHWLEIPFTQSIIWQGAVQAAQPNLSMEDLGNISILIPPEEEVTKIVSCLDAKQRKFRRLSDLAENKIKLLQERRTALISAAVTGKIDVRNWKPEQSEPRMEASV